jgi:predicted RNase H-like HicB family nuclease
MKTHTAHFERDEDGVWCGTVKLGPKSTAISDGPTLERAQARLRQAVALALECPEKDVHLELNVKLPVAARRALKAAQDASTRFDEAREHQQSATAKAALRLRDAGLSLRDIGDLLGVTRQRAQQILQGAG